MNHVEWILKALCEMKRAAPVVKVRAASNSRAGRRYLGQKKKIHTTYNEFFQWCHNALIHSFSVWPLLTLS